MKKPADPHCGAAFAGADTLTYMYNGYADVTALLDNNGNLVATYYYDASGNILEKTGTAENSILSAVTSTMRRPGSIISMPACTIRLPHGSSSRIPIKDTIMIR